MMTKEEILAAFQFRHACKQYDSTQKVSDENWRFILETGRLSPSSFGFEPWRFLVIENQKIKELIRDNAWGATEKVMDCSRFVVILARLKSTLQADSDYITHIMRDVHGLPENIMNARREFYRKFSEIEADFADNERAFYDWACKQTYIALANMMTAAAEIGIDSTPIEGMDYEILNQKLVDAGLYDAKEFKLSVMCAFGYRVKEPRAKTRQAFDDVVEVI